MDYKYIEQLLDNYFEANTSLEEEDILRAFFSQKDIPAHLQVYAELFREQTFGRSAESLGKDFDAHILEMIGQEADETPSRAPRFSFRPLWRAAACMAVVLTLGQAAQMPYNGSEQEQQEQIARTREMLQKVLQDQNSVAQGDSIVSQDKNLN